MNPYFIVGEMEEMMAEWCGSKYAVAVESGSAAILLSILYRKHMRGSEGVGIVTIPKFTYPSVPCSIIFAGGKVRFEDAEWQGEYQLKPLGIWDSALRFKKGMYHGGLQCLSMHIKKILSVGRAGLILTDDIHAYEWLKRARFDGRNPVPLQQDSLTQLGLNMYLEPSNAARAIQLFEVLKAKYPDGPDDLRVEDQKYSDLSQYEVYKQ